MDKIEYRAARRLIRDNGRYALRWMPEHVRGEMTVLLDQQDRADPLVERASIIAYCARTGEACNIRHTQPIHRA